MTELVRKGGWAPKGSLLQALRHHLPGVKSYSVSLVIRNLLCFSSYLTSGDQFEPTRGLLHFHASRRRSIRRLEQRHRFLLFVVELIVVGVLLPGDVYILDNASIHWCEEIVDPLDAILEAAQVGCVCVHTIGSVHVDMRFLPA